MGVANALKPMLLSSPEHLTLSICPSQVMTNVTLRTGLLSLTLFARQA